MMMTMLMMSNLLQQSSKVLPLNNSSY